MVTNSRAVFAFESVSGTDVGQKRKINEDSYLKADHSGLWVVADGMGGHAAGDFASQSIVTCLDSVGSPVSFEDLQQRVSERVYRANHRIRDHAADLGRGSVGSTLVALSAFEGRFLCYWCGDSRVYLLREGRLRQVTRDHTEVQELLDAEVITPEQAASWPRKNVITRAIGVTPEPEVDMVEGRLKQGDLFLLCSDGLTEYFEDRELFNVLSKCDWPLDEMCRFLVSQAVERGGKDNVTVVLVKAMEIAPPEFEVDGQFPEFEGLL